MPSTAISITNGKLGDDHGKTAHGLIRGSERFKLIAVLDPAYEGRDAGEQVVFIFTAEDQAEAGVVPVQDREPAVECLP